MLKKPRRGWWVVPGGKMESQETLQEAVKREFFEETGLSLEHPELRGVFTIVVKDNGEVLEEWMLFTYYANQFQGIVNEYCEEGQLEWVPLKQVVSLPKAEGDNVYFEHIFSSKQLITGTFVYTPDYQLISYRMDPLNQKVDRRLVYGKS